MLVISFEEAIAPVDHYLSTPFKCYLSSQSWQFERSSCFTSSSSENPFPLQVSRNKFNSSVLPELSHVSFYCTIQTSQWQYDWKSLILLWDTYRPTVYEWFISLRCCCNKKASVRDKSWYSLRSCHVFERECCETAFLSHCCTE